MQFELTHALIDDILFSMEDQENAFLIDTRKGVVVGAAEGSREDPAEPGRYAAMPGWDSASGFRLMERFVAGVRNPLVQERLNAALNRGRGVFRAFKDTLGQFPEMEKRWFAYKDREMKRHILDWYNGLREEWGLEKIGLEPEDTGDLVLEDFRFRAFREDDAPAVLALRQACGDGPEAGGPRPGPGSGGRPEPERLVTLVAETTGGDFAGCVSAAVAGRDAFIDALAVKPEYRGLGVGEALLARLLEVVPPGRVTLDLPVPAAHFSTVLSREGFVPVSTRYVREAASR